ncbi:unnamed protein product [Prunus armeniaca]
MRASSLASFFFSCSVFFFQAFRRPRGVQLQEVAPAAPRDLQGYFHGFQEVVRPRRPHCGSASAHDRSPHVFLVSAIMGCAILLHM